MKFSVLELRETTLTLKSITHFSKWLISLVTKIQLLSWKFNYLKICSKRTLKFRIGS